MWSVSGLLLDILGVAILYFNGNFERNFNRLDGFEIWSADENGKGGGMKAISSAKKLPKLLDHAGFIAIVLGFVLQLIGAWPNDGAFKP